MIKNLQIRVFGKVQGVWFRKSTHEKAVELGVKGIVMNESDGSVYIEASAEEETMEKFVAFCKQGPPAANVQRIVLTEIEPKGYLDFQIIH